jgi:hypothetical protein
MDQELRETEISRSHFMYHILLILLFLLSGCQSPPQAFAQGSAEIILADPEMLVVFTTADTNDSDVSIDPGMEQNVASCKAQVNQGTSVVWSIYNGYPGYSCTLRLVVQNRGENPVRMDDLEIETPGELIVTAPGFSQQDVLLAGGIAEYSFTLSVLPHAEQGMAYQVSIRELFVPVEQ